MNYLTKTAQQKAIESSLILFKNSVGKLQQTFGKTKVEQVKGSAIVIHGNNIGLITPVNHVQKICSLAGCNNSATLGAHIYNDNVEGERIVPACDSCNKLTGSFNLKGKLQ